jgi:hypothetical protein
MPIVTASLYGGLGNQLFQIAATIAYSIKHGINYQFKYMTNLGKRPTYWSNFLHKIKNLTEHLDTSGFITINEDSYGMVPATDSVVLDDYFQSPHFFNDCRAQILETFDIETHQRMVQQKYNVIESSISIHFRRGDYKQLLGCHPILPDDYYTESIYYILTQDSSITHIYYYCEDEDAADIERVITEFETLFEGLSWSRVKADADWEEMVCMSCSRHHVIANSSFSWWGAYLSTNNIVEKNIVKNIVCYPALWFGPLIQKDVSTMFPPDWIKIWI